MKKSIIVLYHASCPDGFTAAWAARKALKNAEYIAVKHGVPPPKGLENKDVFLLDFFYGEGRMEKILRDNNHVTIIDHHITVKQDLAALKKIHDRKKLKVVFNNSHSGATLAWEFFHPGLPVPQIVRYVEDTDLWKFQLPHSREISSFLELFDFSFKRWDKLARLLENGKTRQKCVEKGKLVRQYEGNVIKEIVGSAIRVEFEGHTVLAANCPILRSEIGHELAKKRPPFSIVWRDKGGQIVISLRSNGRFDVARLAEKYGGGGHKAASGFTLRKGVMVPWQSL